MYESIGFISTPHRRANGYRVFTEEHVLQAALVRLALNVELVQNGLRKEALAIVTASAARDYKTAALLNEQRRSHIMRERDLAEQAVRVASGFLGNEPAVANEVALTRKEVADRLDTTIDALRNWEMNGLLNVKRKRNGYRVYGSDDIRRLAVIRAFRLANYSIASILRLLNALEHNPAADIRETLDTPDPDEDILSVCDSLVSSLDAAEQNAREMGKKIVELSAFGQ